MDDFTGLGKVADSVANFGNSKLPNKVYDDLLTEAMQEGGKTLTDVVKAFRLFLAPIQLLAVAQDRLAAFCERVRAKVPETQQQEAVPSIALPVLMNLRFMEDNNPLTELFLNLLARAIDRERCNEAHPAYVKIIEQMSPDEAMVMFQFRSQERWPIPPPMDRGVIEGFFPLETLANPKDFRLYFEHLESLNLLQQSGRKIELEPKYAVWGSDSLEAITRVVERDNDRIQVTSFGRRFIKACISDDFDIAKSPLHSPNSD